MLAPRDCDSARRIAPLRPQRRLACVVHFMGEAENKTEEEDMRRTFAGFCVAAAIACAGRADAQPNRHARETREARKHATHGGRSADSASASCPPSIAGTSGEATPAAAGTTTTTGSSGQTGVSGDALLDGLVNFNIQQLLVSIQFVTNVQDTVINVTDVLNDFQIQALLQLLNSNPVASQNATELSLALQQSGLLAPGERVVGVTAPTIRDNKTLTKTLQQQGILQPGERVVGAKGARVYKTKG